MQVKSRKMCKEEEEGRKKTTTNDRKPKEEEKKNSGREGTLTLLISFPPFFSTTGKKKSTKQQKITKSVNKREWSPPPVADTKAAFYSLYRKPLPAIYNVVLQELLVQAHLVRHNVDYSYDAVYALGLSSVLDAVLEGLEGGMGDKGAVFDAFIDSLGEDPKKYRSDAAEMEKFARESAGAAMAPSADGSFGQRALAAVASRASSGELYYSRFLAVGIFRLLELSGAKDPKALGALSASLGVPQASVARDLGTYKAVLSKLAASKELMRELLERERKKKAEREAEKAAKAASGSAASSSGEEETENVGARAGEVLP